MLIMWRELEVPTERARICVERDHAVGIQIVTRPIFTVEIRRRITHSPVDEVELRIVRPREPGRCSATLPGASAPRLGASLAWQWHRGESPCRLARCRIESR